MSSIRQWLVDRDCIKMDGSVNWERVQAFLDQEKGIQMAEPTREGPQNILRGAPIKVCFERENMNDNDFVIGGPCRCNECGEDISGHGGVCICCEEKARKEHEKEQAFMQEHYHYKINVKYLDFGENSSRRTIAYLSDINTVNDWVCNHKNVQWFEESGSSFVKFFNSIDVKKQLIGINIGRKNKLVNILFVEIEPIAILKSEALHEDNGGEA